MPESGDRHESLERSVRSAGNFLRLAAALIGIAAIVLGLIYGVRVFVAVYGAVHDPEGISALVDRWAAAVGGAELDVQVGQGVIPLANLVAVAALGGAALILCLLAMAFMSTGARIISWTTSDKEAVKRILRHAFGPAGRPASPERAGGPESAE